MKRVMFTVMFLLVVLVSTADAVWPWRSWCWVNSAGGMTCVFF